MHEKEEEGEEKEEENNMFFVPKLAERATPKNGSGGAAVWGKVLQLAKGEGVVDLGQGYPDFPGNRTAREEAAKALLQSERVMDNQYSAVHGLESLRYRVSRCSSPTILI
jgi:aspartate/methionine/tyrosine aminotransferase